MKIVFATNNEHKLREVQQILGDRYDVLSLDDIGCHADIPETAETLEGNAMQKARYVHERYGMDVFADDTGLEVEALGGQPGVHTARYAGEAHDTEANVNLLLSNMERETNRRACFRTAIALIKDGAEHLFEGRVDGEITRRREGDGGFGYDPVFRPEGYDGTFAELGADVKNRISHRARAVQRLVEFLSCMLLCLMPMLAGAQPIGSWTLYPAYGDSQLAVAAGRQIWAVSSGNLWEYDTTSGEITTFDRTRGLSDVCITHIGYSAEAKCVIAVYENANIDIIDADTHHVYNIAAVMNCDRPDRTVNDLVVSGSSAWIAMAFGMVHIDLKEHVVRETYMVDGGVRSVCVSDMTVNPSGDARPSEPTLFYAGTQGVRYAPLTSNLHDMASYRVLTSGTYIRLYWWQGLLLATTSDGTLRKLGMDARFTNVGTIKGVKHFVPMGDDLLVTTASDMNIVTPALGVTKMLSRTEMTAAAPMGSTVYAVIGYEGLVPYAQSGGQWVKASDGVLPNGPRIENFFRMRYAEDRLLIASGGGDYQAKRFYPGSLSVIEDGICTNLDTCFMIKELPYHNLMDIVEDPADRDHRFACAFGGGLLEYRGTKMVKRYTADNSILGKISSKADKYTRVCALAYDSYGTLWMFNAGVDTTVVYRTSDGKWGHMYHPSFTDLSTSNGMASSGDYLWLLASDGKSTAELGVMCIKQNGTSTNLRDDVVKVRLNPIVQQDGLQYDAHYYYCITPDLTGQLWVGTDMGLFVIESPEAFFQNDFTYKQIKINRNDGSGLADYLMNGLWCTGIAVDPANRKWVGTDGQGVYLISADGQQELLHFTTENSPLPSDNITSIAVSPVTGAVAIGTRKGLVVYAGDAQQAADELDADNILCYPNPVPPLYNGSVTISGLTLGAEVKIATVTGQVIYRTIANGGTATWNCCDSRGRRVATGVYNVIANTADGSEGAVTRIVVAN